MANFGDFRFSQPCPSCGYCPHCGRSNQPIVTQPVWPYLSPPLLPPWWNPPVVPSTTPTTIPLPVTTCETAS